MDNFVYKKVCFMGKFIGFVYEKPPKRGIFTCKR